MKNWFKTRYRIVQPANGVGFDVQVKNGIFGWCHVPYSWAPTLADADATARRLANPVVKVLDDL